MERNINLYYNDIYDVNTNLLSGEMLYDLLLNEPKYCELCNLSKLHGNHWCLLLEYPQFSEFCNWDKFDDSVWNYISTNYPEFLKYKK